VAAVAEPRFRFPPSPTGYLHIGGARTALYIWLWCRKLGGKFVLRIEDTDTERSTEASTRQIIEGLQWMGIDWDEGPYNQSDHADEHRQVAETLIARGAAYRCFCPKEELDAEREAARAAKQDFGYDGTCRHLSDAQRAELAARGRPSVVRFRVPDDPSLSVFDDLVFGRSEPRPIEDFVIVRSTGEPLYVLSNAVDDRRDRITHVIRGQEHLMNTPKQVLIYRAMDWPLPLFAHLAILLDPKKAKISKRQHGEVVAVQFYQDAGFLPWAFCNFIALLGWSPGDDREVYLSRDELLAAFSIEGLGKKNAIFNYRVGDPKFITDPKALHINGVHLRELPVEAIAPAVQDRLAAAGLWREAWAAGGAERAWFLATIHLLRERFHLLADFVDLGRAYFSDDFSIEEDALAKGLRKDPALRELLPALADRLAALASFDVATTEAAVRVLAEERGVKAGLLINAARAAVSGQAKGPGLFDILVTVGQARTVERLRKATQLL
jgi:glutamyl-tRNA synthetase